MNGLLFQRCTITKKVSTTNDHGTPIYTDSVIASSVPCRLDTMISKILNTTERSQSASFVEEVHGILYLRPVVGLDETCKITIVGDNRIFEVIADHKAQDYGSVHHTELEVRTVTHR